MNITTIAIGFTAGSTLALHGAWQAAKGNKKTGYSEVALGIALVAGIYFYQESLIEIKSQKYIESIQQMFENRVLDVKIPLQECSLPDLLTPIKEGAQSERKTIFDLLNKTRGVTCDNFLPWRLSLNGGGDYMDGIRPEHLKENVMWGFDHCFDTARRYFVAMRVMCSGSPDEKVALMFQRYSDDPNSMYGGGHYMESRACFPWTDALTAVRGWTDRLVELFTNNSTQFPGYQESITLA